MAERNPFLEVKTIVQPTASPVDTFVQPAPVDDTKLRELSTFLNNMTPRVERYAQIERGRKDKKDITRAKKAYADLLDLNLSYDELVKKGEISPEESPVFRYAYHEAKGESLGYSFIQKASEAYFKSNLVGKTSSAGFDNWFNNYKKAFIKNNEVTLNELGAFDPFNNLTKQAQSSLMNQHLANVRKNVAKGASTTSLTLMRQIINKNIADAEKAGIPLDEINWEGIGANIHAQRSELAKVSKKPFKEINDETLEDLADFFTGFDNPIYFEKLISGMKTTGGDSLATSGQGRRFIAELSSKINKTLNTQTTRNNNIRKEWANTTQITLTDMVRPFIQESGAKLLSTEVKLTTPSGHTFNTNFFRLAAEAGLDVDSILENNRTITEGNWLNLIETMASKGTIKEIDGYAFPNGEVVSQVIVDGMGSFSDPDWRNTLIKNLGEEITSRGSTAPLPATYMTKHKNDIMQFGMNGTFMDRLNLILKLDKTINREDAKELYNHALSLQKAWNNRQQTLEDRDKSRQIVLDDRRISEEKAEAKDLADPTDDIYYLEQKRLFEVSIAEALLGKNITVEIARQRKNIFLNSYLNAIFDEEIDYYNLRPQQKIALLQGFQEYARKETQSKNNQVYIPLLDGNGQQVIDGNGFMKMELIDNN